MFLSALIIVVMDMIPTILMINNCNCSIERSITVVLTCKGHAEVRMWWILYSILETQNVETSMERKDECRIVKYLFRDSSLILMTNLKLLQNDFNHRNEFGTT